MEEEGGNRLSELPDHVLVHIMNFMETREAVRTCIYSKRWEELWKRLTTLFFLHDRRAGNFNKFVSQVLSGRDGSISLIKLTLMALNPIESELVNRVIKYAMFHNVQQMTILIPFRFQGIPIYFDPLIFSLPSLTFLKIFNLSSGFPDVELPKSLHLPALKSLHLHRVSFTASDNGCAEPFSTCNLLNTLDLNDCFLNNDAKELFISNSNLSSLTLENMKIGDTFENKIVLSTPNLSSLTIVSFSSFSYHPISSTCNLSCLEEGNIHSATDRTYPFLIGWLQLFTNVKTLIISCETLQLILKHLSNLATMRTQPPCFVRLESLKIVKHYKSTVISGEEVNRVVEYILQNSSLIKVAIIKVRSRKRNVREVEVEEKDAEWQ